MAEEHIALLNANLATKTDIAALKVDIAALKVDIEALKVEMLKWLLGALIAQGGLIVALIKLL